MEYCLPHAVMAFLQEERSSSLPKSYFISSSNKTTKITLIYTRNKSKSFKALRKKPTTHSSLYDAERQSPGRYSSSSTDDYTKMDHNVRRCQYDSCENNQISPRICASTPGRGYNSGHRAREVARPSAAAKMATDPVVTNSPSKDHLSIRNFAGNIGGHGDSEGDDHFGLLSPNSILEERPPTPGRDLSNSPRPPTPNAANYATLMSNTKQGLHNSNKRHTTQSRQPTVDYSEAPSSRHATPRAHQSDSSHHRQNKVGTTTKQTEDSTNILEQVTAESFFNLPPVTSLPSDPLTSSLLSRATIKR